MPTGIDMSHRYSPDFQKPRSLEDMALEGVSRIISELEFQNTLMALLRRQRKLLGYNCVVSVLKIALIDLGENDEVANSANPPSAGESSHDNGKEVVQARETPFVSENTGTPPPGQSAEDGPAAVDAMAETTANDRNYVAVSPKKLLVNP